MRTRRRFALLALVLAVALSPGCTDVILFVLRVAPKLGRPGFHCLLVSYFVQRALPRCRGTSAFLEAVGGIVDFNIVADSPTWTAFGIKTTAAVV